MSSEAVHVQDRPSLMPGTTPPSELGQPGSACQNPRQAKGKQPSTTLAWPHKLRAARARQLIAAHRVRGGTPESTAAPMPEQACWPAWWLGV